jgi:hypothetical protein
MINWKQRIEAFAAAPHKNVSILLKQTTLAEIETILDATAQDAHWADKEIKEKDGIKLISYRTQMPAMEPIERLAGVQIIENTLSQKDNDIQLEIESRISPILTYGTTFGNSIVFFDFFGKNRDNLQILSDNLKAAYQDRFLLLKGVYVAPIKQNNDLSVNAFGATILKLLYVIFIIVAFGGLLYAVIYIVGIFFQNLNIHL